MWAIFLFFLQIFILTIHSKLACDERGQTNVILGRCPIHNRIFNYKIYYYETGLTWAHI